jgi:hypothetical protein
MDKGKKSIVSLFEENELNVGKLYGIYSKKIRGKKIFWSQLAKEEGKHAKDIRGAHKNDPEDLFIENKFSRGVIIYVMDFVEQQIEATKKKKISHLNALLVALRIEQSILEKKCFDIFKPTNATVKDIMKNLNKETEGHVKLLQKELARIKKD